MTKEISHPPKHDDKTAPPAATPPADHLAHAIFTNPEDFLTTLNAAVIKAHGSSPEPVGLADLQLFAQNGTDPKERAAAAIAAAHYDELVHMPYAHSILGPMDGAGLSNERVDGLLQTIRGNVGEAVVERKIGYGAALTGELIIEGLLGVATVPAAFTAPPVAAALAAGLVGGGVVLGLTYDSAKESVRALEAAPAQDARIIKGWQGIGGA